MDVLWKIMSAEETVLSKPADVLEQVRSFGGGFGRCCGWEPYWKHMSAEEKALSKLADVLEQVRG
jgi:hypothetical protein